MTDQPLTPPAGIPKALKIVVIVQAVIIGLLLTLFVYLSITGAGKPDISDYDDCAKAKGSELLTSYPGICVTKDGQSFTQQLSPEQLEKLQLQPSN